MGCCCCCCCCGGVAKENWDGWIGEENDMFIFMFDIELDAANGEERVGVYV